MDAALLQLLVDSASTPATQKSDTDSASGVDRAALLAKPSAITTSVASDWKSSELSLTAINTNPFAVSVGDLVILTGWGGGDGAGSASPTDNQGGTWTKAVQDNYGFSAIYYRFIASASASFVATLRQTGSGSMGLKAYKGIGADSGSPLGGTGHGAIAPTSTDYNPTIFTATRTGLALVTVLDNTAQDTLSSSNLTYTASTQLPCFGFMSGYRQLASNGAVTANIHTSSASSWNHWSAAEFAPASGDTTFIYDYDNGFSTESASILIPISDTETGTGTEAVTPIPFSDVDAGSGIDAAALSADITDTDAASAVEVGIVDTGLAVTDTETATAVDEVGDQEREDAEGVVADDILSERDQLASDAGTGTDALGALDRPGSETAFAVDVESLLADIFDSDTASAVDVDYPIGITDSEVSSTSGSDVVSFLDYTYRFNPPGIQGYRDPEHPLFRRIPHIVGVTVLKIGGTYRQIECPGDEDFAAATETYLGGHDTVVHQETADALTAAGYGAYLTRF